MGFQYPDVAVKAQTKGKSNIITTSRPAAAIVFDERAWYKAS